MGNDRIDTTGAAPALIAQLSFCSGRGQADTRKGTEQSYDGITGREIVAMVRTPPSVPKDQARWMIPSTYMASGARGHEAQRAHGEFWFLCLDVDSNNLSLEAVQAAIDHVCGRCAWMIYSTRSATEGNRKWRALVPLLHPITGAAYVDTQTAFFDLLEDATQGELVPDRTLARTGQLVYLPNRGEFYEWRAVQGTRLDLYSDHAITRRRDETLAKREAAALEARTWRDRKRSELAGGSVSIMDKFNADHDLEALLERYGYTRAGGSNDWRSPMQSSRSFATRCCGDHWISLSDSDAAAGLGRASKSGARFGDAFDLFQHFDHGGNQTAAIRAYAEEIGLDHRSQKNRAQADALEALARIQDRASDGQAGGGDAGQTGQPGQKPKTKFELIRADQLEIREPDYLVDRLIEAETLAMFFGDPGSGKSFAALDVACCVATGAAFHGRKVKRGAVIYICGEGKNGIKRRLVAWERHNGKTLTGQPLFVSRIPAQFLSPDSVKDVIEAIDAAAEAAGGEIALIMVDTLNRNMGAGDENSAKDMTAFISAVDGVKDRYGATALIVHHTGHGNKERARGSMSLLGALDAEYRVEKDGETTITFTCTKVKDGPKPAPIAFDLVQVEVGRNRQNEAVTSAVLTETDTPAPAKRALPIKVKMALDTFKEAKKRAGHGDKPAEGIHVDEWRDVFYERSTADTAEAKKKAFQRYRDDLVTRQILAVTDDFYRLASVPPCGF